ncbi:unnamed protein product, partial [Mesorhabditis belari]|uniref:Uncharacterized protein n=1 Tax=Mesorhabditis belari TaxID=2138241 RepID=A0AAF3ENF1_9BILA
MFFHVLILFIPLTNAITSCDNLQQIFCESMIQGYEEEMAKWKYSNKTVINKSSDWEMKLRESTYENTKEILEAKCGKEFVEENDLRNLDGLWSAQYERTKSSEIYCNHLSLVLFQTMTQAVWETFYEKQNENPQNKTSNEGADFRTPNAQALVLQFRGRIFEKATNHLLEKCGKKIIEAIDSSGIDQNAIFDKVLHNMEIRSNHQRET